MIRAFFKKKDWRCFLFYWSEDQEDTKWFSSSKPLGGHINSTATKRQIKNYTLIAFFAYKKIPNNLPVP